MKYNEYYIVNLIDPRKIRYYPKGLPNKERAREVIDIYLGEGAWLIMSGAELESLDKGIMAYKHSPFSKFTPKEKRKKNPGRRKKRKRVEKILTHKFRAIWEEIPSDKPSRQKIWNKDRTVIRTKILK